MQTLYTAHAKATGGRDGRATSSDGILDLPLAMPKELGGAGNATNPEQLFAAGYSACFLSALKLVASQQKLALPADARVEAAVSIGKADDGGFDIAVQLTAVLPGVDTAAATTLIARAHEVCPYSRATHGNIAVSTELA
ncbi:organic hydroperoxide resistance protein [Crenobacter sp. SG2303]|uniref:Organic hydroperoxide resistance protein n=1 Tax=Crenobacter oryzisoli TaxID=3056844 RepID=A0ABT7XVF9_9NEIS|nr:organic hydroperoxide resistance protein [Crenobacter sp. SG2303]MDN0077771.1 organic hydroperoxide resistance protein [Crenobacter sp. SG2303]